ncbi:MAG TPA: TonB-dependent receptor [Gammaproteobacteria bacterium]|nr:TonB-dependent receptor [Gammaproteobacteria bacterium]
MTTEGKVRISRLAADCAEILKRGLADPGKGVLGLAALSGALAVAPAHAQDAADADEVVLVTGSRIVGSGMQTPTPVTAVTNVELAKMEPGNMVDALSQLPQFFNNSTATNRGNFLGSAGGAYLNVRGLGTDRTLTLLDGRRMPPADRNSAVDTNLFPESLIQRVEVVTGGASAAYGADALSGVVNFILDTDFEGFNTRVQGGQTKYGDGDNWEASFTGGMGVGQDMHVTFAVEGFRQDQVSGQIAGLDDRGWFGNYGYVTNPAWFPGAPFGIPQRLVMPNVHSSRHTPGGKINEAGFSFDQFTFIEDGTQLREWLPGPVPLVGWDSGERSTSGGPEYEVARLASREILTSEVDRVNAFANLDFDIGDSTTAFARLMLAENNARMNFVNGGLGPSMMGIWQGTIFRENAFLPEAVRQAMEDEGFSDLRMDKNGALVGRNNFQDNYHDITETEQIILSGGFDREMENGWTMSGYLHFAETDRVAYLDNILRVDRWFMAMDSVEVYNDRRDLTDDAGTGGPDGLPDLVAAGDRGAGEIICNVLRYNPTEQELADAVAGETVPSPTGPVGIASPVGLDGAIENCVPLNIFGWGNVSQAAQDYVVTDKWADTSVEQTFAELFVSGEVFNDWYAGPISMTVGATYREEEMSQTEMPREISVLGPPKNAPQLGIRGLPPGFTGGSPNLHQFSTFSTFGGSFDVVELFGETLVPVFRSDTSSRRVNLSIAARHSDYSRAGELDTWKFGVDAQVTESFRIRTTVSKDAREATFIEQFDLNGGGGSIFDPAFNNDRFDITVSSGGNPDLQPEEADTIVFGFVYQPQDAPGISLSADYYDIDLSQTIGSLGTQRIVDDCRIDMVQQACALIDIDPSTNIITRVSNVLVNIDNARVRGADYELTFRTQPNLFSGGASESLSLRFLAGFLAENSTTPLGGNPLNLAGATSLPELTTTTTLNYSVGPWSAYFQHRWVDETKLSASWVEGIHVSDNTIESINYSNLGLTYTGGQSGDMGWEVFANVINAFNEEPPVIPTGVGRSIPGSTGLSQHRTVALGRRYVVGVRLDF